MRIRGLVSIAATCAKPGCDTGFVHLQRHHRGNDRKVIRLAEYWCPEEVPRLMADYDSFRKKDIVFLCEPHHVQIHLHYPFTRDRFEHKHRCPPYKLRTLILLRAAYRRTCTLWLREYSAPSKIMTFDDLNRWYSKRLRLGRPLP